MTARRLLIAALLASCLGGSASAAVIGVVAPRSGPYAALGAQVFEGARAAATAGRATLVEIEESCEPGGGAGITQKLSEAKAQVVIGFLCVETLSESLPQLKLANIPAISISVRSKILMEDTLRNGWPFFRMAPNESDEAEKLSETMLATWQAEPIALVEDGTIYGRELASAIRQKLETGGITPVFTDTFRPGQEQQIAMLRRLAKAGATHVFVGGDRNDMAIIARDAAAENIPLTLIGGDTLRAANRPVPLRDNVLAVALPDYAGLATASFAVTALRAKNIEPEGYLLPAYAATQVAKQAIAAGEPVATTIAQGKFSTVIGPIAFDESHELADNPFQLLTWRGNGFVAPGPATE